MTFDLDARALSSVDEKGNRTVTPGAADIWIGGGQPPEGEGGDEVSGAALQIELIGSKAIAPF
jgi:beta-glucosidase